MASIVLEELKVNLKQLGFVFFNNGHLTHKYVGLEGGFWTF